MIQATDKQVAHLLELTTGKQLLHSIQTLIDNGYWIDSAQRTSALIYGSADYLIVYHPVNTVGKLSYGGVNGGTE